MLKVILLKGLPGSGKSTYARKLINENKGSYKRVNKDDLRRMMDDSNWSKDNEKFVLGLRNHIIMNALGFGKHVIVDDTNLHPKHEENIRQMLREHFPNVTLEIKDFTDVPIETCIENDLKRLDSVGEKVIRKMHTQYLNNEVQKIVQNPDLEHVVICDLDGTLCETSHRSPYDANICDKDGLNEAVANIIKDKKVIFVSGRFEKFKPQTLKFMKKYNIKCDNLFMRKDGDMRNDYIVKNEIFENEIKNKYYVEWVVDDRLRVCRFWYNLGLSLFRFGNPDADF